jgi:hypothetical protein
MTTSAAEQDQPTTAPPCREEHANLECRMGGSDKVYHVQLTQSEAGWAVTAQNGPRGGTLTNQKAKIKNASYDDAKIVYDRLVAEKLRGKGDGTHYSYIGQPKESASAAPPIAPAASVTNSRGPVSQAVVFAGEHLTRVEEQDAYRLASNPRYTFENKQDGDRLTVRVENQNFFGYNKKGQVVSLTPQLHAAVSRLCLPNKIDNLLMDGEWERTGFYGWDLLECKGTDLRTLPQEARRELLEAFLADLTPELANVLHISEIARSTEDKLAMLDRRTIGNRKVREGVAIKDRYAAFREGRNGQHKKFKFEFSASFIVGEKPRNRANDGKRNVALYILDPEANPSYRFVSTVKVPDCYELPPLGSIIDARYLSAFLTTGGIEQPCYFGKIRTDVRREDCTTAQLIYKEKEEEHTRPDWD